MWLWNDKPNVSHYHQNWETLVAHISNKNLWKCFHKSDQQHILDVLSAMIEWLSINQSQTGSMFYSTMKPICTKYLCIFSWVMNCNLYISYHVKLKEITQVADWLRQYGSFLLSHSLSPSHVSGVFCKNSAW